MARGAKKETALTPEERLAQALVPEAEQPYRVPENWRWTTVGCVSEVVTGGTPSKKHPEYYGEDFPFFKPSDLDAGRNVYEASEYLSQKGKAVSRIIPAHASAVCCIGSVGKCGFLTREGTTNQQINSAIPRFNPLYLYYYFQTEAFVNELKSKASATTISIVNKSKMEQCSFPLPPLPEQQRIVDRIESLFAKLDEAKEKAQAVVDGFEDRKAAILHKAFTGELTAEWRKEKGLTFEDTWIQGVLGDYASNQYGYTEKSTAEPIGPNFLRITDIQNGQVKWNDVPYCKIDDEQQEKYALSIGDIVVARTGATTGKSYMVVDNVDAVYASYLIRVTVEKTSLLKSKYLYYFLDCPSYWRQITELSSGIAQPGVNGNKLKTLKIPVPFIDEQEEIIRLLDCLFPVVRQAKAAAEQVISQIDTMKKAILARAFRGELGTNDPTEESAEGLLKETIKRGDEDGS